MLIFVSYSISTDNMKTQDIFIDYSLPLEIRYLSIIQLKNGIDKYWRKTATKWVKIFHPREMYPGRHSFADSNEVLSKRMRKIGSRKELWKSVLSSQHLFWHFTMR
jgi:hypothetical protein